MSFDPSNQPWGPDKLFITEEEWREYQEDMQKNPERQTISTSPHHRYSHGGMEIIKPVELATLPEPGPRIDLVDGLLPENQITILYGDGAQGKSFLALALGAAVASGNPFLGLQTMKRHVLYVDWELDHEEHARRAYKIARGVGLEKPPSGLFYYRAETTLQELLNPLSQLVHERSFGLLILDSFGAACGGDPEQARSVIPLLASLRSLNTSILVLDHQAKMQEGHKYAGKTPFGSAYKFNLARSVIQSQKVDSRPGELVLLLRPTKYNLGVLKGEIPAKLLFGDNSVCVELADLSADPAYQEHLSAETKIYVSLTEEGPATAQELTERTGITRGTVTNILSKLKQTNRIVILGKNGNAPIYSGISIPPQPKYEHGDVKLDSIVEQAKDILGAEVVSQ